MADATLSPQQAAQALADLSRFEGELSARVGALTGMVWGIVSAAIFVTYGVATDLHPMWLMAFLWLPWTAAGIAVTIAAWNVHAVSLRRPHDHKRSWTWSLGFAALFIAAIVLLHVLGLANDGAFPYMLVVNGLVGLVIASKIARFHGWSAAAPMVAAGLAIIGGAFALGAADLPSVGMAFSSAALVGTCFVGASLTAFVRG